MSNIVLLTKEGQEVSVGHQNICDELEVDGFIRISTDEYDHIDYTQVYFGHFNLERTNHVVGNTYALAKIKRNGVSDSEKGIEQPPLLSLNNMYIVECIEVKNDIAYIDIPSEYFTYSMNTIKTPEELEAVITKRYSKVRKGITKEEIYQKGVGFTLLKIIRRIE